MGFIALRCPSCGAEIELDSSREFGFCQFCGTKIVQEKKVIEHRGTVTINGNVSVDGIATLDSTLERAFMFIDDLNFSEAEIYLQRALDASPKCAKAYWGLLLCQMRTTENIVTITACVPLERYSYYKKAVMYADDKERAYFASKNKEVIDRLNKENAEAKNARLPFIGYTSLYIVLVFAILFFIIGTTVIPPMIIAVILLVVGEIFVIKKCVKCSKPIKLVSLRKQRIKTLNIH